MVQIYALCCGFLEFDRHVFFPDRDPGTRMTIPVSSYLLIHPKGRVLFDTGVHRQAITDPIGRLGERRATRFTVRSQVGDAVSDADDRRLRQWRLPRHHGQGA